MKKNFLFAFAIAFSLSGCWANFLHDEAQQVVIVNSLPEDVQCSYKGEVIGSQGNMLTGKFTTNKTLIQGSRNELRNEAAKLGANVVVISETINGTDDSQQIKSVTYIGRAFSCQR